MTWRPILSGDLAARARAFVDAATEELGRREIDEPSLAFGTAGLAMLHGYRARDGVEGAGDLAFATLARTLEQIEVSPWPWLFQGYAGIGFALHHLADVVGDAEETIAELDALVAKPLAADHWTHAWELQFGAIGLGVYGIERGSRELVDRAVHHLGCAVETSGEGQAWITTDAKHPEGYFNLGMTHGVAGAIGFLAEVIHGPQPHPRAEPLLRGALAWLRPRDRAGMTPGYPMWVDRRLVPMSFGEILDGWCYGDPATALVLVRAGQALGDTGLVAAGHELARRAARRTPEQLAAISIDETICHGTAGHAHIFHRLALALEDDELIACARGWYERTLAQTSFTLIPGSGLQTGLAGIALGTLAGYSSIEPAWDLMFLLR